jgi:molybdenum cofactor cytidylyltransferase
MNGKMNIPSRDECIAILKENKTPSNVIEHTLKVAEVAEAIADNLIKKGIRVNRELVAAAALLHDVEKPKEGHASKGAEILDSKGYPEVARIVKYHSYYEMQIDNDFELSIEHKIVFYADKRVRDADKVSVEERYEDLEKRYKADLSKEKDFVKKIAEELGQ